MEYKVTSQNVEALSKGYIISFMTEDWELSKWGKQIDTQSGGYLKETISKFKAHAKKSTPFYTELYPNKGLKASGVCLISAGNTLDINQHTARSLIKKLASKIKEAGVSEVFIAIDELKIDNIDGYGFTRLFIDAIENEFYSFTRYKSNTNLALNKGAMSTSKKASKSGNTLRSLNKNDAQTKHLTVHFVVKSKKEESGILDAIAHGQALHAGIQFTKDLANTPPNVCTPTYLGEQALALGQQFKDIKVKVLDEPKIKALKMGALLGVTMGSAQPPRFIILEYMNAKAINKSKSKGKSGNKENLSRPICLVGKGVTFDTGGSSLKSPTNMIGMKYDMCGAASVLGVIKAAAMLKLPLNIIGIIPACENMPGSRAQRPDDIVQSMSGTTIEVLNTDAEGRLILCDALTYCERYEPKAVIDIATLTGACVVALGRHASGLYSNNDDLLNQLNKAGIKAQDRAWPMPLWEEYHEQLSSNVADLCNIGGPEAGSVTAASFLSHFTKKYAWAHLDVAGTACQYSDKNRNATGRPVPLLLQYLIEQTKT